MGPESILKASSPWCPTLDTKFDPVNKWVTKWGQRSPYSPISLETGKESAMSISKNDWWRGQQGKYRKTEPWQADGI